MHPLTADARQRKQNRRNRVPHTMHPPHTLRRPMYKMASKGAATNPVTNRGAANLRIPSMALDTLAWTLFASFVVINSVRLASDPPYTHLYKLFFVGMVAVVGAAAP
jgi:hypothetical protein